MGVLISNGINAWLNAGTNLQRRCYHPISVTGKTAAPSIRVTSHLAPKYRQPNNLEVKPKAVPPDILEVVLDAVNHLLQCVSFTSKPIDLSPAGDARLYLVAQHVF